MNTNCKVESTPSQQNHNLWYNTSMRKNLFLYLALACFVGLIAIFVVDGYMGIYDTVYITTGKQEYKVDADVGIACGKGRAILFKKGEKIWTVEEKDFVKVLMGEVERF